MEAGLQQAAGGRGSKTKFQFGSGRLIIIPASHAVGTPDGPDRSGLARLPRVLRTVLAKPVHVVAIFAASCRVFAQVFAASGWVDLDRADGFR